MRTGDVGVAVALAVVALAGCSHDHAGSLPPPSIPVSPNATATAHSTTESRDTLAREVVGAVRNYYAALTVAVHDPRGGVEPLAPLLDPACECRAVLDGLRREAAAHRHVDYSYAVRAIDVIDVGNVGADVTYTLLQTRGSERDDSGNVIRRYPAATKRFSARLVRRRGRWVVRRLVRQP